ncbi:hypothetical protein [Trichormus azollae]|uniref:hypothetical protein n=1 Tax=Trichormus azollae TaxID=1164 RepID=UPI00325E1901
MSFSLMSDRRFSGDTTIQSVEYCMISRINQNVLDTFLITGFTFGLSGIYSTMLSSGLV